MRSRGSALELLAADLHAGRGDDQLVVALLDDVPTDLVIGLDHRFAVEEVITVTSESPILEDTRRNAETRRRNGAEKDLETRKLHGERQQITPGPLRCSLGICEPKVFNTQSLCVLDHHVNAGVPTTMTARPPKEMSP